MVTHSIESSASIYPFSRRAPEQRSDPSARAAGVARILLRLVRWWARRMWKVTAEGWESLPSKGGALVIANHLSYTDAILLVATCPRPIRLVGSAHLLRFAVLRWVFRAFGVIPVRPNDAYAAGWRGGCHFSRGKDFGYGADASVSKRSTGHRATCQCSNNTDRDFL